MELDGMKIYRCEKCDAAFSDKDASATHACTQDTNKTSIDKIIEEVPVIKEESTANDVSNSVNNDEKMKESTEDSQAEDVLTMPVDSKKQNDIKCDTLHSDEFKHEIKVEPLTDVVDNNGEQINNEESQETESCAKCEKIDVPFYAKDASFTHVCTKTDKADKKIKEEPLSYDNTDIDAVFNNSEAESFYRCCNCDMTFTDEDVFADHMCSDTEEISGDLDEDELTEDLDSMFEDGESMKCYKCDKCELSFIAEDDIAAHKCAAMSYSTIKKDNEVKHEQDSHEKFEDPLCNPVKHEKDYLEKLDDSLFEDLDNESNENKAKQENDNRQKLHDSWCEDLDAKSNESDSAKHDKDNLEKLDDSLFDDLDATSNESETENDFKCEKCGATFLEDFELSEHKCSDYEKRHGHFECTECGRHFRYKVPYEKHLNAHALGVDFKKIKPSKRKWVRRKILEDQTIDGDTRKRRQNNYNLRETPEKITVPFDYPEDLEKQGCRISHYECGTCGRHFRYKIPYEKHLAGHDIDVQFPCETCGENFRRRDQLNKHKRTHTGEKPYMCEVCGMNFNQKTNLQSHVRTHSGEKPYECKTCGKHFVQKSHLNTHARIHDSVKPYMCELCGRTFSERASLQKHNKVHERDLEEKIKKKAEQCNSSLNPALSQDSNPTAAAVGQSILQNFNMYNNNDPNPDPQTLQTQATDESDPNRIQYPIHNAIKTQTFGVGRLLFSLRPPTVDKEDSIVSIKNVERPYVCEYCGDTFRRRDQLRRHRRIHTGERPYSCEECGTTFTQRSNFTSHMRIHSGEKPFKCEVCGKDFIQKSHLNTHSKIHIGLKPYKCESCGKAFLEKASLAKHNRIHTGERPYKCEICGKAFRCSSNIAKHRSRGHLSEQKKILATNKTFACDVCGLWFNAKQALSKHMKVHAEPQYFQCKACGKEFTDESYLNIHIIKHASVNSFSCATTSEVFTNATNDFSQSQPVSVSNMVVSTVETPESTANHNSCMEYGTGGSTFPPRYPPFYYPQIPGYPYKPYPYE